MSSFVLFYAILVQCLPVPAGESFGSDYPWWAKRISVGNILLHEIVFLVWLSLFGIRRLLSEVRSRDWPMRSQSLCLIALALWCGIASFDAPLYLTDLGRTLRLLVLAALMLFMVRWAEERRIVVWCVFLAGMFVGTLINLTMSFQHPFIVFGAVRLAGQSTPGVVMSLGIHFTAWCFAFSQNKKMSFFACLSGLVFIFAASISFSRLAWLIGILGICSWLVVLGTYFFSRYRPNMLVRGMNKRILIYLIPLLFMIGALTPYVKSYVELLQNQQGQKMSVQNQSNQARWSYFIGTEEILKAHPLGVGYSGFYDAMTATSVYKSGQAAREESRSEANPHATFLWYATAGGYVGAVLATILFMLLLHALVIGLSGLLGKSGYFLFLFIALSYLLMGMTIPYLFNSLAMIGPAALVLGLSKARSEKIVLTEKG